APGQVWNLQLRRSAIPFGGGVVLQGRKRCPRLTEATSAALSAATCGVLTRFTGSRPSGLGHLINLTRIMAQVNSEGPSRAGSPTPGSGPLLRPGGDQYQ